VGDPGACAVSRRILVIHGSKRDVFQQTDSVVTSDVTLEHIDEEMRKTAAACGMEVDTFQSEDEKELARRIKEASEAYNVMVIDLEGHASKGVTIREALSGLDIPIIEVHVANAHAKANLGQNSLIGDKVTAQLAGFGKRGYVMAVGASANLAPKA